MLNFLRKKKIITSVADAIAPLQQIVNDLHSVVIHQQEQVENAEIMIDKFTIKKNACKNEANLADGQVKKMIKAFGVEPNS